ncbi:MAG: hypothetical protein K2M44_01540 [Clostridia bacterium]|nr:hypothetical protein [Clostridia bacterium]
MNRLAEKTMDNAVESEQYGAYYMDTRDAARANYNNNAYNRNSYAYPNANYAAREYAAMPQQYYAPAPVQHPQAGMSAPQPAYMASYDRRYAQSERQDMNAADYDAAEAYGLGDSLGKEKKKRSLNFKAKMLIVLYFAIIAIVATLIFVNIGLGAGSASAEGAVSEYTQTAPAYMETPDGQLIALDCASAASYDYDSNTNWFDNFCDWVDKQVG